MISRLAPEGSAALAKAALEEVFALSRDLFEHWERSSDWAQAVFDGASGRNLPMDDAAASFVARCLDDKTPHDVAAHKLSFAALSLVRTTKVFRLIAYATTTTYRRMVGVLAPYIEEQDLFDDVRQRLWSIRTERFSKSGILKHPGILGFLARTARNVAIDHCRRLTASARRGE